MAVAGGEGDAAKGGERGSDVGGSDGLKVFAGLDAVAHEKHGHMLVVIVGRAVAGAVGAGFSCRSAVHEPVRFRNDEEFTAAPGEITKGKSAKSRALRGGTVVQFFGAIDGGDAGLRERCPDDGLHSRVVVLQLLVNAGSKINVAAVDARNSGFGVVERRKSSFDLVL